MSSTRDPPVVAHEGVPAADDHVWMASAGCPPPHRFASRGPARANARRPSDTPACRRDGWAARHQLSICSSRGRGGDLPWPHAVRMVVGAVRHWCRRRRGGPAAPGRARPDVEAAQPPPRTGSRRGRDVVRPTVVSSARRNGQDGSRTRRCACASRQRPRADDVERPASMTGLRDMDERGEDGADPTGCRARTSRSSGDPV